ncbi:hypothetical protein [Sulfuritalea sp.]|uniref:hypothetical protein n=1 Tax=Sulfuritalea sp. TaxID=2480090 RepID=UPI00286DD784|nr:hypothetical protein [Sulfuritalea sp.]
MTITKLALSLMLGAGLGAGCTTVPPSPQLATSDLPNCFDTNYDRERGIFTMKNEVANAVNQQCLLIVHASDEAASASQLVAGRYTAYLANGGGGGAGGTLQSFAGSGGGGGGGAGAMETQAPLVLSPGAYKLTLGAGGPGGTACMPRAGFSGGPGWVGSPSNMIRVATGEVVAGVPGADSYVRLKRRQNEKMAGKMDGHGGSGVGQTEGGHAAVAATATTARVPAEPGGAKLASGYTGAAGAAGSVSAGDKLSGAGGGGGATAVGSGGGGGGESPGQTEHPPQRGTLGGGGGGGEGTSSECDPGARGGHGYIALRRI